MAPPPADALRSLDSLIRTASTLLRQLQAVLAEIHKDPSAKPPPDTLGSTSTSSAPLDALALAHDSASLVRAHGTKVSLLIINEPFTPSAISSVVRELVAGPVPAIVSAAQACTSEKYTATLRRELASRCRRVLVELHELLQKVPQDGKALAVDQKLGFAPGDRGSIPATGILWAACDHVINLARGGVGGFYAQKTGEWRDMLKDVLEEMKEWGDEEPNDHEDGSDDDNGVDDLAGQPGGTNVDAQDMIDDLMSSQPTIPRSDPNRIRPRLESSLRRLRLIILFYEAAIKRRFKKLPALPPTAAESNVPSRLDNVAQVLQRLPDRFEDLAGAFYELQPREIDEAMEQCFADAVGVSELLAENWDGAADEFSAWVKKFQVEISKTA
ncbi:Uncharacterized protein TCAP_04882 [Tolypocladium capitatum]|uniref:Cyclin-D1-binding protein 1-like N-terminal domain-containing protein n=1 Tax=Tolypocladium capitatum TaxID=45235 RepID=A0A2K3QCC5_9HYPO|nr:Uncharacterized protein TCAP_04882 [Tolypocladium capitatum]